MTAQVLVTDFLKDFQTDHILSYQKSDAREGIYFYDDHITFEVGGFIDSVGTHYSRGKYSGNICSYGERVFLLFDMELPANFYEQHQASIKVACIGGEKVDSSHPYYRIGVWIGSDKLPRLQLEVQGTSLKKLVQGAVRLPVGKHSYVLEIIPHMANALTKLYIDGVETLSSATPNMSFVRNPERAVFGIDGAASQDTRRLSITFWKFGISDKMEIPIDCTPIKAEIERASAEKIIAEYELLEASRRLQDAMAQLEAANISYLSAENRYESAKELFILAKQECSRTGCC